MATVLNIIPASSSGGNTGVGAKNLDVKNIVGAILTPKKYQISAANLATLAATVAALIADIANNSKDSRLFPIFGFEQIADNSEDIQVQTTSIGSRHVVREGYNDWKMEYFTGALSLLIQLRKFNFQDTAHDFLFIDANGTIIGTQGIDGTGAACLQAIPCEGGFFRAHPFKMNDGSKLAQYMLQFVFAPKYINELIAYVKFEGSGIDLPTTLLGLQDVNLSGAANATSGSYDIVPMTPQGTYLGGNSSLLVSLAQTGAWVATNAAGLVIPITGVVAGTDGKTFTTALDKTSANYPAGAGAKVLINFVAPTQLAALATPITGFESTGPVSIVKN